MIIIGAGLAGAISYGYFSSHLPEIYESREAFGSTHKAILRFKDLNIGYLLGVPLEEIEVSKSIYYQGQFVDINPMVSNLYSKKVAKGIYDRSIITEGEVKRFIANRDFEISGIHYEKTLVKLERGLCYFSDGTEVVFDVCISTIPLPFMMKAIGISGTDLKIESYDIQVARIFVKTDCRVYQTIYFPELQLNIYRATLEPGVLIVEFVGGQLDEKEWNYVLGSFGLEWSDLGEKEIFTQKMGKIVEMDDLQRKDLILRLTEEFGVYSFGRYATWRNISSEHLLKDLRVIDKLLKLDKRYQMRLETVK